MNTVHSKIHEGWKVCKFKDVVLSFKNGGTPSTKVKSYWEGNIPWITGADIVNGRVATFRKFISQEGVKNSATNIIPKGNLLLVTRTGVGKVAIAPMDIAISQDITGITLSEDVNPQYAYWYFLKNAPILKSLNQGTSINGIIRSDLEDFTFMFPNKKEQQKIAEILATVDEAIEKSDNIITSSERIRKGLIQTLLIKGLPGKHKKFKKTEIGEIPEEWDFVELGKHVKKLIVPMRDKPKRFSGIIPWCRIEDFDGKYLYTSKSGQFVDEEIIKEMNLKIFPKGTIICSCSATLGICAISGRELITNQTFIGIVPNESFDVEFLYYLMSSYSKRLQSLSSGTTIAYLPREEFEKFEVVKPPKDEQERIVTLLTSIDDRIDSEKQKKLQLETLEKGLMQVLLTGKVRVKVD